MTAPKDGGPAFPVPHTIDGNWQKEPLPQFSGMSLRDWFAGQALAGMLAHEDTQLGRAASGAEIAHVKGAYAIADQMLAARENGGKE